MDGNDDAIQVRDLRKNYRKGPAGAGLNGFDLRVAQGTVCGLLGPNGAGKTTAIRILATLLRADSGTARVAGFDLGTDRRSVRSRIGVVGQYAAVDEILSGRQNLVMFGRLMHLSSAVAARRADELLERFDLTATGNLAVGRYSGGMRRRLDLAAALIIDPAVLLVDEPTTGLDPAGRQEVWQAIRSLVGTGTTVLLTTQYLHEADELADRITFIGGGRVLTEGTPEELKAAVGPDRLEIELGALDEIGRARAVLAPWAAGEITVEGAAMTMPVADRTRTLVQVVGALAAAGIEPLDLSLRRPTLDEVFLRHTGPLTAKEVAV
ncbi:ATP-binding cassette domain-containing protein [Nakamurella silvestris]|nr:ATP-binding cassette domain-containing protein [Nakamurella silvestris]